MRIKGRAMCKTQKHRALSTSKNKLIFILGLNIQKDFIKIKRI